LLKSLEEPPDFVIFMFASTHPQEFPPAIMSRLQRFDVRRLTTDEIEGKLRRILDADGRKATPEAVHLIARLAAGGMRDAESMLDQLLSSSTDELDEGRVRDLLGLADAETISGFVNALVASDALTGIRLLDALEERGRDLRGFLDQVIEALRAGIVGAAATQHPVAALAAAARRLASIDPSRAGVGGLRLHLELALFPDSATASSAAAHAVAVQPAVPQQMTAQPAAAQPAAAQPAAPPAPATPAREAPAPAPAPAKLSKPKVSKPAEAPAIAAADAPPPPPPEAPAPTAAASNVATPAPTGDLAVLRDRWPVIVARISAHPPTKPLIVACRPVSVEEGVVTLGFPEDQAFLRAVADRRRNVLEEGIGAVLGRTVAVRCIATNLGLVPDLVTAAVNDALDASRRLAEQKMGALSALGGGLGGLLGR